MDESLSKTCIIGILVILSGSYFLGGRYEFKRIYEEL